MYISQKRAGKTVEVHEDVCFILIILKLQHSNAFIFFLSHVHSSKRGLDLGLGRGYSGSQAAKHLMGLAAANFAGGPGRRRRSDDSA